MQITLKVVLNSRHDGEEFYTKILHPKDVILASGVEGVDAMEVDKDDLEEAEAAASFAEKVGVFISAPPIEIAPPQASKPSISKATFDKLVVEVKALVL